MEKIFITAKPGSKKPGIEKTDETHWIIRVREPATEGKANKAVLRAIADELKLPISRISILRGEGSRNKVITIS